MRATLMRFGGLVLTAMLITTVLSGPARSEPGFLEGRMIAEDTGQPLQGCVRVYHAWFGNLIQEACTDESGRWVADQTVAGTIYDIELVPNDDFYIVPVNRTTHTAPATIEKVLPLGGKLQGTLTKVDGGPAADKRVVATNEASLNVGFATTSTDGSWAIPALPPGDYRVRFEQPAGWFIQYAVGADTWDAATLVGVEPRQVIRVDDQIRFTPEFTGHVVSDTTGEPIEGICIDIFDLAGEPAGRERKRCTKANGRFAVDAKLAPGRYKLGFYDPRGQFAPEFYSDARRLGAATEIEVVASGPAKLRVSLADAAKITAVAVDSQTSLPLPHARADVIRAGDHQTPYRAIMRFSGEDGRWRVTGLMPGRYKLMVWDGDHAFRWLYLPSQVDDPANATAFQVRAGETLRLPDVPLEPWASAAEAP